MKLAWKVAVFSAGLLAASCAPSALEGGFDSPNPAAKLYAIEQAAREGDRRPETLASIVEQLDSDDPVVRLLAITALERLTGDTLGYEYDAPASERRPAIRRWQDRLDSFHLDGEYASSEEHHG